MLTNLIMKKIRSQELTLQEYYEAIDELMKSGPTKEVIKFFLSLNSFGMSKKEVYYLTLAIRDSGKVLKYNQFIMEKHSTGGIGDSSSIVLIPLLASLGYKIIKNTARSFVFTNGSADRFGAIPGFSTQLSDEQIRRTLETTNACVLSHKGDMCPADKYLFDIREDYGIEDDMNLLAASIASKKLASGAKVVLVDVKYGEASIVKNYRTAKSLARTLKYIFNHAGVKSIIFITDTIQTIGDGIGNSVEVVDALNVLQGRKCVLRDMVTQFATEMILAANPKLKRKDTIELIHSALDNGYAYNRFLEIVKAQGGDEKVVREAKLFKPYHSTNFISDTEGYVGSINSLVLGELVRRLCADTHDSNIGVVLRVKIGDYIKKGDIILSFYYKDKQDLEKYHKVIAGSIRATESKVNPVNIVTKVMR